MYDDRKYAEDKPKSCDVCYFREFGSKECSLGWENCYYLKPEPEKKREKDKCDGCPYGRVNPCIGYCLKDILAEKGGHEKWQ